MKKSELRKMIREELLSEGALYSSKQFGDLVATLKGSEKMLAQAIFDKASNDPRWDRTFSKHIKAVLNYIDDLDI